jgi:hypothetical protein
MVIQATLRMQILFLRLDWVEILRILRELTVESCLELIKFVIQFLFLLVEAKLLEFVHIIFVVDLPNQLLIGGLYQR